LEKYCLKKEKRKNKLSKWKMNVYYRSPMSQVGSLKKYDDYLPR
jgi:hypothetical protein